MDRYKQSFQRVIYTHVNKTDEANKQVALLTAQLTAAIPTKAAIQSLLDSKDNEIAALQKQLRRLPTTTSDLYKKVAQCNVCNFRIKDTVITRCWHVFCKDCVDIRIETRQRKCMTCGEAFGIGDVKSIFI